MRKAKRGELCVVEKMVRYIMLDGCGREYATYMICQVAGISKDGRVKKLRLFSGHEVPLPAMPAKIHLTNIDPVKTKNIMAALSERDEKDKFYSLEEVRKYVRQFL